MFSKKKTDQNSLQIQSKLEAKLSPDFGSSSVSLSKRRTNMKQDKADKKMFTLTQFCLFKGRFDMKIHPALGRWTTV